MGRGPWAAFVARFDEVKATFCGEGRHGVQPPLTDAVVRNAERRLGVRLPAYVPLDGVMGIGRHDGQSSLLDTAYLVEEWGLPSPLVLLSGDGHCWVALDYRVCGRQGEPSVTWFDVDDGTELPPAADFQAFMERLTAAASLDSDDAGGDSPAS